ncbi:FbpB family small basic protein [Bacillus sp. FJAT-18017]|nr:FbpB family small basic protein [Bacillus sp. FJAT-18017]
MRKPIKVSFSELVEANKDELLENKEQLDEIEKRVEEKFANSETYVPK